MITEKDTSQRLYEIYYMKVYSYVMTLAKNKDTYTCGKGGNELKLEATSGDVSILKK